MRTPRPRFGPARKPIAKLSRAAHRRGVHRRVRRKVRGSVERPRLNVFRSHRHLTAQIIDDSAGRTLVSASSLDKQLRPQTHYGGNVAAAKVVGQALGERAQAKGITRVVFDRGGYKYHGRIKALAEAARQAGLEF